MSRYSASVVSILHTVCEAHKNLYRSCIRFLCHTSRPPLLLYLYHTYGSVADPDSFRIRIQHFKWILIGIHGFYDHKMEKILQFTYPKASLKNVQATGEAFSPQRRTSSTSKIKFIFNVPVFS